jgi:DNA-binding MurR/RpiR family transcriptional regulator
MTDTKCMQLQDFTAKHLQRLDRNQAIVNLYKATNPDGTRKYLTVQIAAALGVSESTVLRAARAWGVAQSHAEANRTITHLKRQSRLRGRRVKLT